MEKSQLEKVREKQLNRFIALKFHEHIDGLGITEEKFRDLAPLPENKESPLLVVSKEAVSLRVQMELVGTSNLYVIPRHKDMVEVLHISRIYWIYGVENGKDMLNVSPLDAGETLARAERRGFVYQEAIALEAQFPGTLKDHSIDVVGCQVLDPQDKLRATVPCLSLTGEGPEPGECSIKRVSPYYGAPSCLK